MCDVQWPSPFRNEGSRPWSPFDKPQTPSEYMELNSPTRYFEEISPTKYFERLKTITSDNTGGYQHD